MILFEVYGGYKGMVLLLLPTLLRLQASVCVSRLFFCGFWGIRLCPGLLLEGFRLWLSSRVDPSRGPKILSPIPQQRAGLRVEGDYHRRKKDEAEIAAWHGPSSFQTLKPTDPS